jgi:cell division protein FtsQ
MELSMPTGMVDLFADKFQSKPLRKASVSNRRKAKKHSKKDQASKNRPPEIKEFVWLKKYLTTKVIFTIFILSAVIMAPFYLSESDIMPVEKIRIQGAFKQLDTARVKNQLEHYLGQGFFSVDIQSMQQEIEQQAWIQSVSVQRVWPAELNVNIVEKTAFARWDEQHLLSTDGVVFKADSLAFSQLPLINGFVGDRAQLLRRYQQLQQRFSALGLHLNEMKQDSKGALFLRLKNQLLVKLGSEQIEKKINHLLAVFPVVIQPEIDAIRAIDFRYSNGFAIAWKDDKQPSQEKQLKRGRKHV